MQNLQDQHPEAVFRGLGDIAARASKKGLPPVHLWNPDFCGDIDMRIAADGTWFYNGSPIGRLAMVRLFSSVLRKDDDGKTYLVTPVEKIGITVDDAHFIAKLMTVEHPGNPDQKLRFTTNVEEEVIADKDHPLRFEIDQETMEPRPYVLVRGRLEALINRAVFYDIVEIGEEQDVDGVTMFGVRSGGVFFPICPASDMAV